jgi:hypothetical protein
MRRLRRDSGPRDHQVRASIFGPLQRGILDRHSLDVGGQLNLYFPLGVVVDKEPFSLADTLTSTAKNCALTRPNIVK